MFCNVLKVVCSSIKSCLNQSCPNGRLLLSLKQSRRSSHSSLDIFFNKMRTEYYLIAENQGDVCAQSGRTGPAECRDRSTALYVVINSLCFLPSATRTYDRYVSGNIGIIDDFRRGRNRGEIRVVHLLVLWRGHGLVVAPDFID